ncbi:hypothetical protein AAF712_007082 [Marasmius tenuissimus]|uniref:Piwi domain-containing protein n=1 Tax=Marasmius tenuissimus TaxID=585030 RepID=A0ABR2ZW98_9AGAR
MARKKKTGKQPQTAQAATTGSSGGSGPSGVDPSTSRSSAPAAASSASSTVLTTSTGEPVPPASPTASTTPRVSFARAAGSTSAAPSPQAPRPLSGSQRQASPAPVSAPPPPPAPEPEPSPIHLLIHLPLKPKVTVPTHVEAIGVKRGNNFGTGGTATKVLANYCPIKLNIHNTGKPKDRSKADFMWYHRFVSTISLAVIASLRHGSVVIAPTLSSRGSFGLIDRLQLGYGSRPIFDAGTIEDKKNRVAYDGKKILYAARRLDLGPNDSAAFQVTLHNSQAGQQPPRLYEVRLTKTAEINPEILNRLIDGTQSSHVSVAPALNALNVVFGMKAMSEMRKPVQDQKVFARPGGRSFFSNAGSRDLGGGYQIWRGYFQSVRPGQKNLLLNVDTNVAMMYSPGHLIGLCLQFLGREGANPNVLAPRFGFPDAQREGLRSFLIGMEVLVEGATPGRSLRRGTVSGLTRLGAADELFVDRNGQQITVANYFHQAANRPLQFPNVVCITTASSAKIPLERCIVPPGCFMKREIPERFLKDFVKFSSQNPRSRLAGIKNSLAPQGILDHTRSEYLEAFGVSASSRKGLCIQTTGNGICQSRYARPVCPLINTATCREGKKLYESATIFGWMMIIYEVRNRFNPQDADRAADALITECGKLGIKFTHREPLKKYENGQGDIQQQLIAASQEFKRQKRSSVPPSLIVVVVPKGAAPIYQTIKHCCDVKFGVATQCLQSFSCKGANSQYWANVCLKINGKLGGTNVLLDPSTMPFLRDKNDSTIIMGADVTHPPPGLQMKSMPSYSAVVASMDSACAQYRAILRVQKRAEMIADIEDMCRTLLSAHMAFKQKTENLSKEKAAPKRLIFYRDGVSEGEFDQVLNDGKRSLVKTADVTAH